jgi:hypothetical protein
LAGIEKTRNTYQFFLRKHREKKFTWKTEETRRALWRWVMRIGSRWKCLKIVSNVGLDIYRFCYHSVISITSHYAVVVRRHISHSQPFHTKDRKLQNTDPVTVCRFCLKFLKVYCIFKGSRMPFFIIS